VKAMYGKFYRPPIGGLSAANDDTSDLNRPGLVLCRSGAAFNAGTLNDLQGSCVAQEWDDPFDDEARPC
jgi:hypothetical protein